MNSLSIYKPNSKNTGSASQFSYGLKEGDKGLYINLIKQHSWNATTRSGSFSENAKDPQKTKKIKINEFEAAAIVRVIETNNEWSTVHKSADVMTSIAFKPWTNDGKVLGYSLSTGVKNGTSINLSLTVEEVLVLSVFLTEYIKFTFTVAK